MAQSSFAEPSHILALNSGSSSLKFGLYRVSAAASDIVLSGEAESVGGDSGRFHARDAAGKTIADDATPIRDQSDAVVRIARLLEESDRPTPAAIGHRIVHGGPALRQHCLIDADVMEKLEKATVFAPLHTPPALAVIRFAQQHFPGTPQVACFDTQFHAQMPDAARTLPLPRKLRAEGVERYGFHGLSCESIVAQLGAEVPDRLIIAHLGNGASVTAVKAGRSIDTSMGLTPSGGVIMGTRAGDIDPGVLVYLMREKKLDVVGLEELIDHRSGLLGISGLASDMRKLTEAAPSNSDATLAIRMFCDSVCKRIAGMITVLNGVDLLVFTGGIGEHDAAGRAAICEGLSWIGIALNPERNEAVGVVSAAGSRCAVRVIVSDEDGRIAQHAWRLVEPG